jgi:hypothetical protein
MSSALSMPDTRSQAIGDVRKRHDPLAPTMGGKARPCGAH